MKRMGEDILMEFKVLYYSFSSGIIQKHPFLYINILINLELTKYWIYFHGSYIIFTVLQYSQGHECVLFIKLLYCKKKYCISSINAAMILWFPKSRNISAVLSAVIFSVDYLFITFICHASCHQMNLTLFHKHISNFLFLKLSTIEINKQPFIEYFNIYCKLHSQVQMTNNPYFQLAWFSSVD